MCTLGYVPLGSRVRQLKGYEAQTQLSHQNDVHHGPSESDELEISVPAFGEERCTADAGQLESVPVQTLVF
jgi:hypothetical protein